MTFALAAHADWSTAPAKRWMTVARPGAGWTLAAPVPVGDTGTLFARLRAMAGGGAVALGIDVPLGLPRGYVAAHLAGVAGFPAFVRGLLPDAAFFRPCASLEDVRPERPFYPARGVLGVRRAPHAAALGLDGADLSRWCDRATAERPAGASLFWTLGANQTGKAAIAAWRDLLLPALAGEALRLWPFDGDLLALAAPGTVVLAETYPAEAMRHVGLRLAGSKQRQADRAALGQALLNAVARVGVAAPALVTAARAGFGRDRGADDGFDSVLGALGVLEVLAGRRPDGIPADPWLRRWEGWVLGQTALPISECAAKIT